MDGIVPPPVQKLPSLPLELDDIAVDPVLHSYCSCPDI